MPCDGISQQVTSGYVGTLGAPAPPNLNCYAAFRNLINATM